jgi:hypothetical protein
MPNENDELIQRFYAAFDRKDGDAMAACYMPDARFDDPVFPGLTGREPGDMWRMLTARRQPPNPYLIRPFPRLQIMNPPLSPGGAFLAIRVRHRNPAARQVPRLMHRVIFLKLRRATLRALAQLTCLLARRSCAPGTPGVQTLASAAGAAIAAAPSARQAESSSGRMKVLVIRHRLATRAIASVPQVAAWRRRRWVVDRSRWSGVVVVKVLLSVGQRNGAFIRTRAIALIAS